MPNIRVGRDDYAYRPLSAGDDPVEVGLLLGDGPCSGMVFKATDDDLYTADVAGAFVNGRGELVRCDYRHPAELEIALLERVQTLRTPDGFSYFPRLHRSRVAEAGGQILMDMARARSLAGATPLDLDLIVYQTLEALAQLESLRVAHNELFRRHIILVRCSRWVTVGGARYLCRYAPRIIDFDNSLCWDEAAPVLCRRMVVGQRSGNRRRPLWHVAGFDLLTALNSLWEAFSETASRPVTLPDEEMCYVPLEYQGRLRGGARVFNAPAGGHSRLLVSLERYLAKRYGAAWDDVVDWIDGTSDATPWKGATAGELLRRVALPHFRKGPRW